MLGCMGTYEVFINYLSIIGHFYLFISFEILIYLDFDEEHIPWFWLG